MSKLQNTLMSSTSTKIPHPKSTRYQDDENDTDNFPSPVPKRRRLDQDSPLKEKHTEPRSPTKAAAQTTTDRQGRSPRKARRDAVGDRPISDENADSDEEHFSKTTQLEAALPSLVTDEEAVEAYEAYQAEQAALAEQGDLATLQARLDNGSWTRGKNSIYVDAFNLALETVLEQEGHLFNEAEQAVFTYWRELDYESQYLYVRLFLRKTSSWFRINKLAYFSDIKDIDATVRKLQQDRILPGVQEEVQTFPGEITLPEDAQPLGSSFRFAEASDDHINTLDEASSLLLLDELKALAKDAKVQGKTKKELIQNLRRTSGKQTGLSYLKRTETEESVASSDADSAYGDEDDSTGSRTPTSKDNRDAHYTKKILEQTGKCIRLSLIPLKLFERVHLVFYRSTEWTDKSLTTVILAKISRRNFPEYIVSRSANIFESRRLLLEFEASLRTQFRVDNVLEFSGTPGPKQMQMVMDIFEAVHPRWQALVIKEREKEEKLYETGEGAYLRRFSPAWVYTRIVHKGLTPLARFKTHKREHELLTELLDQRLFHAARRGAWYQRKALLEEHYMYALTDAQGRSEEANKKHWKRISLRTCEQGLQDNECHLIYHYDLQKRIVKLEKQLRVPKREQHEFGHTALTKARERTIEGIQLMPASRDHTPSRSSSLRRQNSTTTPPPAPVSKEDKPTPSIEIKSTPQRTPTDEPRSASHNSVRNASTPTRRGAYGGKTFWLDHLDTSLPVSVENFSLSYYRHHLGYKGYHSEGGILRTLFGLLFYDIMFSVYVPNVFQTPYQTCPLDLHTDAFYSARISEINMRINEIGEGKAEQILRAVWNRERERETCIIGVRWNEYALDDLCELVRCFGGLRLGTVMRVLAQEYGGRSGGVPDLFLWKAVEKSIAKDNSTFDRVKRDSEVADEKPINLAAAADKSVDANNNNSTIKQEDFETTAVATATATAIKPEEVKVEDEIAGNIMFVEVKSENDRLSDTQRLWISVLVNAGIPVEICHVLAREVRGV